MKLFGDFSPRSLGSECLFPNTLKFQFIIFNQLIFRQLTFISEVLELTNTWRYFQLPDWPSINYPIIRIKGNKVKELPLQTSKPIATIDHCIKLSSHLSIQRSLHCAIMLPVGTFGNHKITNKILSPPSDHSTPLRRIVVFSSMDVYACLRRRLSINFNKCKP